MFALTRQLSACSPGAAGDTLLSSVLCMQGTLGICQGGAVPKAGSSFQSQARALHSSEMSYGFSTNAPRPFWGQEWIWL